VATPTPGCANATTGASVIATPAPPDIPTDVRASGTSGTVLVSVQLDASGGVTNATVTQGTGNSSLDVVALGMARDARYSPALRDCKPVAGAYVFSVRFVAW
jgi:periplasmic protein TonB